VAVQTVLRQNYWAELKASFNGLGNQVVHVVLEPTKEPPEQN
jgi:hypothetical protein